MGTIQWVISKNVISILVTFIFLVILGWEAQNHNKSDQLNSPMKLYSSL